MTYNVSVEKNMSVQEFVLYTTEFPHAILKR
jgi:hypothetical protein